jgi:hypothetical protein
VVARSRDLRGGTVSSLVLLSCRGEVQAGKLRISGKESEIPYQRGDTFILRFNPKRPSRYYYENVLSNVERAALIVAAFAVGAAGALVMTGLFPK